MACPGLSGVRCYTLGDRAGEVCALRLLIEDDLLQGQLGEGGEGRAGSDPRHPGERTHDHEDQGDE